MKILQLVYTSCRKGISSGAGFQTFSMSDGITEDERKEIERYGLYVPPAELPTQPDEAEIESLFPVSFTFFRLKSSRYGVCRSKYIGRDYSGRYGNYFCHALILEKGRWPFYPVELYGSPVWRHCLSEEEENTDKTPSPLPILRDVPLGDVIGFDPVSDFLQEEDRIDSLKNILNALLGYPKTSRRLILCDHQENIPYWIAACQMAFPLKLSHELTFTTYTHDPDGVNYLVSSTPRSGSRFSFSETQRNFQYYIFDFIQSQGSRVEGDNKYIQVVEVGYTLSKDSLIAFQNFIEQFDYSQVNHEIDAAYYLYTIVMSGVKDMSYEKVISAIEFANAYATPEVLDQLFKRIEHVLDAISSVVDIKVAEVIAGFLFKIADITKNSLHLDKAYNFLFNSIDHLVFDGDGSNIQQVFKYHDSVSQSRRDCYEDFVRRSMEPERLGFLATSLSDEPLPQHAEFYLSLTIGDLIKCAYTWRRATAVKEFERFLQTCVKSLLNSGRNPGFVLVASASGSPDFFARLVTYLFNQIKGSDKDTVCKYIKSYNSVINSKTSDWALSVRDLISGQENGNSFLYAEFYLLLKEAKAKKEFFWHHHKSVFLKIPVFHEKFFSKAVENYLECLSPGQVYPECYKLLQQGAAEINDDFVLAAVIRGFEQGLPLSAPTPEIRRLIPSLSKLKQRRNIATSPDITELIALGMQLEEVGEIPVSFSMFKTSGSKRPNLEKIESRRYREYLEWCLPGFISMVSSPEDHGTVMDLLKAPSLERELISKYTSTLESVLKKNKAAGGKIFQHFIVYYLVFIGKSKDMAVKSLQGKLREDIVNFLGKQSESQIKKFDINVEKECGKRRLNVSAEWKKICKEAEEIQKNSFFGRIKGIFKKEKND